MKTIGYISTFLILIVMSSCKEETPSTDWKEKDNAAEKKLQEQCETFKESLNYDCDCFIAETKKMFPDLKKFYEIRSDETKYAKENDAWFATLDAKCAKKQSGSENADSGK